MGIFPPACSVAAILAASIGGAGLMVATSKAGLVWAKAAMAVSARQTATFLRVCIALCVLFLVSKPYTAGEAQKFRSL
jgi:hypothetical protein